MGKPPGPGDTWREGQHGVGDNGDLLPVCPCRIVNGRADSNPWYIVQGRGHRIVPWRAHVGWNGPIRPGTSREFHRVAGRMLLLRSGRGLMLLRKENANEL
jgi:hypothetical protein